MKLSGQRKFLQAAILIIAFLTLAGCDKTTQTPATPTTKPTIESTAAPAVIPASLILVDAAGSAPLNIQESLQTFAATNTLEFRTSIDFTFDFAEVKIVVVLDAGSDFQELVNAHPDVQFLFIGESSTPVGGNISIIKNKPEDLAFMAGQLTTLVSEDWRSGGLLNANGAAIEVISDAFVNGGNYVCGWCKPTYPPYLSYPVYQDISGKAGAEMIADVEALSVNWVAVTFVSRAADLPEVIEALQTAEIAMIGENANSAEAGRYAAILGFGAGTALEVMLPKLLAGEGGQEAVSRVVLVVVNDETLVTPGRQDLFNMAAEALQGGWIIPLSVR